MSRVEFFVTGVARPKGSFRAFNDKAGNAQMAPASRDEGKWRVLVAKAAREAMAGQPPIEGPVTLKLAFYRQRPKGHFGTGKNAAMLKSSAPRRPTSAPDASKLARSVEDALNGVVFRDDAQVVLLIAEKRWCDAEQPYVGVHVAVWWGDA
jgi:Holliday junction resolvase RusA-like endonuclease